MGDILRIYRLILTKDGKVRHSGVTLNFNVRIRNEYRNKHVLVIFRVWRFFGSTIGASLSFVI